MVQILQRNDPWQGLGESLGTGLSGGLQHLANQKIQQLHQKQTAQSLRAIPGANFSPEEAQALAGLDPAILQTVLKQKLQAPQNQAFAEALGLLTGNTPQQEQGGQPGQMQNGQRAQPQLNPQQAFQIAQLQQGERKLKAAEKDKTLSYLQPQIDQWRKDYEGANSNIEGWNELKVLNDSGQLLQGKNYQLFNKLGVAPLFFNGATEVAQKTAQQQLFKTIGDVTTPGKTTDAILKQLEKGNVTLGNTKEGADALLDLFILRDKAEKQKYKEYLKASAKGDISRELPDQIAQASKEKIKKLADKKLERIKELLTPKTLDEILPGQDANGLPDKTIARGDNNKPAFIVRDGKWTPIKG